MRAESWIAWQICAVEVSFSIREVGRSWMGMLVRSSGEMPLTDFSL